MGAENTKTSKQQSDEEERAKRLKEYERSSRVNVGKLYQRGGSLRSGDIICRSVLGGSGSSSSSSEKDYANKGLQTHFAVYDYCSGNTHYLIEKVDDNVGKTIIRVSVEDYLIKTHWSLLTDCRYSDTYDMAYIIYSKNLDAGYDCFDANCEHFVTFCLLRDTKMCCSLQAQALSAVKTVGGTTTGFVITEAKLLTHPFYKLFGGEMDLDDRIIKSFVPFGLDADGIIARSKVCIGCSMRPAIPSWSWEF